MLVFCELPGDALVRPGRHVVMHLVLSGEQGQSTVLTSTHCEMTPNEKQGFTWVICDGRYREVLPPCSRTERVSEYCADSPLFTSLLTNVENMRDGDGERLQRDQPRHH